MHRRARETFSPNSSAFHRGSRSLALRSRLLADARRPNPPLRFISDRQRSRVCIRDRTALMESMSTARARAREERMSRAIRLSDNNIGESLCCS